MTEPGPGTPIVGDAPLDFALQVDDNGVATKVGADRARCDLFAPTAHVLGVGNCTITLAQYRALDANRLHLPEYAPPSES